MAVSCPYDIKKELNRFLKNRYKLDPLIKILARRLTAKGMSATNIPAYIRDINNSLFVNAHLSIQDLNWRLKFLGWEDFDLDDHTFQLIMAINEEKDAII